jgi:hypothetical protein
MLKLQGRNLRVPPEGKAVSKKRRKARGKSDRNTMRFRRLQNLSKHRVPEKLYICFKSRNGRSLDEKNNECNSAITHRQRREQESEPRKENN